MNLTTFTAQESILLPLHLVTLLGTLLSQVPHWHAEAILEDPSAHILYLTPELTTIMNNMRILSEGINNLVTDADFPNLTINESMDRYRNITTLHLHVEELFHHLQRIVTEIENYPSDSPYYSTNVWRIMFNDLGDKLREENNLLVEALRSLEDSIRDINPAFEFLPRQWFE